MPCAGWKRRSESLSHWDSDRPACGSGPECPGSRLSSLGSDDSLNYHGDLARLAAIEQDATGQPNMNVSDRVITKTFKPAVFIVILASLWLTGAARPVPEADRGGLCCLCMCHSLDENKCARVCVRMQHGTKVIEEPEMKACTKSCLRHGVKQIFFSEDGSSFIVTKSSAE